MLDKLQEINGKKMEATEMGIDFSEEENGLQLMSAQNQEQLLHLKIELLEFLECSDYYNAAEILQTLEGETFLEEQAVGIYDHNVKIRLFCPS